MKNEYQSFKKVFDEICNDIADKYSPIGISYSGGIDSTSIALGFKKTDKPFFLIHSRLGYKQRFNGGDWNKLWEDYMSYDFSRYINVPLISANRLKIRSMPLLFKNLGLKSYITGNGMDRCYQYMGLNRKDGKKLKPEKEATLGEDFHCFHPLLDKFFVTIPRRIKYFNKYEYVGVDRGHIRVEEESKKLGLEVIHFSTHPLFIEFFRKYKSNIRDVIYPKTLTYRYVNDHLGMDYFKFCQKVFVDHKGILLTPFERLMWKLNRSKQFYAQTQNIDDRKITPISTSLQQS